MSENFKAVKKKYLIAAIISSVILGICCGVGLTCALAVLLKRLAVDLFWAIYIPIALGIAAVFGGLFFLILRPDDKRVAKKLDRQYGLRQKVQTMVEYSADNGAMATLQRGQADEALAEIAKKRIDLKWLLKFAFIPVLAVAMLFTGIFVPLKKRAGTEEPPYNITETQLTALKNLIADVSASNFTEKVKGPSVEVLNTLKDRLQEEQPQSVMRAAVISSARMIDSFVAAQNSYTELYGTLSKDEKLKVLAGVLVNGATYFSDDSRKLTSISAVEDRYLQSDASVGNALGGWRGMFMTQFIVPSENGGSATPSEPSQGGAGNNENEEVEYLTVTEQSKKLTEYAQALEVRLNASAYYGKDPADNDALYLALTDLRGSFVARARNTSNMADAGYYEAIYGDCTLFVNSAASVLATQAYDCMINEFIRNSLARIFNLSVSDFGDSQAVIEAPDSGDDPGNNNWNGGIVNPGDIVYGSDDLILNKDYDGTANTPKQVPYGQVLKEYSDKVIGLLNQPGNSYSEEMKAYIEQYYQMLYGGINED